MSQIDELYNNLSEDEIATYSAGDGWDERYIIVTTEL